MANKTTKRDFFNAISTLVSEHNLHTDNFSTEELLNRCAHELELLDKKNATKSGKPTADQLRNAELAQNIHDAMQPNRYYQIAEMIKTFPCCEGLSTSKVSGVLRQYYVSDKNTPEVVLFERVVDKRKTVFVRVD